MNKGSSERWHKVVDAGGVGMWWHGGLISRRGGEVGQAVPQAGSPSGCLPTACP